MVKGPQMPSTEVDFTHHYCASQASLSHLRTYTPHGPIEKAVWLQLSNKIIPKGKVDGVNYEDLVALYRLLDRPATLEVHLIELRVAITSLQTESKHGVLLDGMEWPPTSEYLDTFLSS